MRLRHRKHSFYLSFLLLLLTAHSVQTVAVRRHFADAKTILTLPKLLRAGQLFQSLRDSFLPSLSDSVDRQRDNREKALHNPSSVRYARSVAADRQSATDDNFVIFASSPGKNGHIFSTVQNPDKDSRQRDNKKEPPPTGTEPLLIVGTQPAESGSDSANKSQDDNVTTSNARASDSQRRTRNSGPTSSPHPVPEADVYLNVTTNPRGPKDSISIITEPELRDPPAENDVEVELSVVDSSPEEILKATLAESASPEMDDDNSSGNGDRNDADDLKPQPSAPPGPQEEVGPILLPPDTEDVDNSPDPAELVDEVPIESANPLIIISFESAEMTEVTPESVFPKAEVDGDKSPVKTERRPSSTESGVPAAVEASVEPSVLVDVPLSVSSSEQFIPPEFDNHTRNFLGETTNTNADQWKPTELSTLVRTSQRRDGSRWEITYQGELSQPTARGTVNDLERGINEGAMDTYLAERLSTSVFVRTASKPSVDAPPRDEISVTGTMPIDKFSGNATTNQEDKRDNLGVILGTCFGVIGALIASAAVLVFVRRRRGNDDEHLLDGVATAPTTILSFETDRSESRFQTGAPTKPRGPQVLRNQSRILDWQMDHATATGEVRHILGRGNRQEDLSKTDTRPDEES